MVTSGNNYYEHGSTARKIKYDVYSENTILRNKRKKVKYTGVKIRILLCMLLAFGCGMIIMYRYALITDINYKIDESKRDYNKIKNENLTAKVKMENSLDLAKVREIAEGRFGMHKPQKDQIVNISVPKADYIKTNDDVISNDVAGKNNIASGLSGMAKIVGLIK